MRKVAVVFSTLLLVCLASSTASAATIGLFEFGLNVNGTLFTLATLPAAADASAFDPTTGLGKLTYTKTVANGETLSVAVFFDHEIDEATNTFFNEYGVKGSPIEGGGWSWEIDEPGYSFGDIYDHLTGFPGTPFDDTNAVPAGSEDDVSMAIGHTRTYGEAFKVTYTFELTGQPTAAAFWLKQVDPDSPAEIYLTTSYTTQPIGGPAIPEPGTMVLLLSGLGVVAAARFRKSA